MIKKIPDFNPEDPVVIVWDDAYCHSGGYWRSVEEVYETKHERTLGYFVHATDRFITVAQTLGQGEDDEETAFGGTFSIPVGFIVSVDKI